MKNWRINIVLIFIFLFGAALLGRLIYLQVFQYDFYSALAKGQQKFYGYQEGERGKIFLKNHELPVATDETYFSVYISPREIPPEKREETISILSKELELSEDVILEKIKKNKVYQLLKKKLSQEKFESLKKYKLAGIYFKKEKIRYYPYGNFASKILGFVNQDGKGQYGLEGYWDDDLKGKKKFWQKEKGPWGFFSSFSEDNLRGSDLYLTIDYNIQYQAEKLLEKAKKNLNIESGQILVADPNSGRILALADFPNFNPNEYFKEKDFKIFQNSLIQKVFEPGSAFKPITMAGALNEGKITPWTTYSDPGVVKVGRWSITNYAQRVYPGQISMIEVLEKSINTGAVFVEDRLGDENFLKYIKKFGIFEKTEIDLEGEILSPNTEFKKGYKINFVTASFGQGIEMTPIQLVRAYCAIANGGRLVRPYLVEKIKKNNNEIIEIKPQLGREVITNETSSKLTAMLVRVVEEGFGKGAKIPGYYIAGKTGTAQIPFSALGLEKKGYSNKTWQSFIGYAPAFNPKFLILVKLDNPATKTAEYSAVPIFRELAKYIIDYYRIPPDYE